MVDYTQYPLRQLAAEVDLDLQEGRDAMRESLKAYPFRGECKILRDVLVTMLGEPRELKAPPESDGANLGGRNKVTMLTRTFPTRAPKMTGGSGGTTGVTIMHPDGSVESHGDTSPGAAMEAGAALDSMGGTADASPKSDPKEGDQEG